MKHTLYVLLTIPAFLFFSCSSPSEPAPVPDPDLSSKITGVYTLTKLTNKDAASTVAVTGTGSATITAVSNKVVSMRMVTKIRQGTSNTNNSDIELEYTVSQTGTAYAMSQGDKTYGTVSDNKLTRDITVPGNLLNPTDTYLTAEFIR